MAERLDIHSQAERERQSGFSLVEMLVALTLMLIVMAAVFACLKSSFQVSTAAYELADAQQSLRAAHEYINRDLVVAGDGLNGINNIRLPTAFVQTYLTQSPVLNPSDPGYVNLSLITSDDNVSGATTVPGTAPLMRILGGSDRITILEMDRTFTPISLAANAITPSGSNVSISPADVGLFSIGEIYFITSGDKATFGVITDITGPVDNPSLVFNDGDPFGLNLTGTGGPINFVSNAGQLPTTLMRMNIAHYFVNSNGLFIKRLFGIARAGFVDIVIAEHVVGLQFRYALNDRDVNGNFQQPVNQLGTTVQQAATRQVEIAITTETAHPVNNGAPQQLTMTTTMSIRNLQFRLAQQ
jgi:prepilin-type N-terminal cleavage/methylation domain-containing protein